MHFLQLLPIRSIFEIFSLCIPLAVPVSWEYFWMSFPCLATLTTICEIYITRSCILKWEGAFNSYFLLVHYLDARKIRSLNCYMVWACQNIFYGLVDCDKWQDNESWNVTKILNLTSHSQLNLRLWLLNSGSILVYFVHRVTWAQGSASCEEI